jgi:hypothetical protein
LPTREVISVEYLSPEKEQKGKKEGGWAISTPYGIGRTMPKD